MTKTSASASIEVKLTGERPVPAPAFLGGGGELGERMRQMDWSSNRLGPPEQWPQSLKTAVRIMLTSRQPIWIGWGPELIYLYNDPYRAIIGGKHPHALGLPTKVVWREIWDVINPMLTTAMTGDEGTYVESQLLIMERHGYREETYYTFSYSPIPNDDGSAGGIICANTDDTRRVIGERQLALLRELAARTTNIHTWQEVCAGARTALASNSRDIPFALIYIDGEFITAEYHDATARSAQPLRFAAQTLLKRNAVSANMSEVTVSSDHLQLRRTSSLPGKREQAWCCTLRNPNPLKHRVLAASSAPLPRIEADIGLVSRIASFRDACDERPRRRRPAAFPARPWETDQSHAEKRG